MRKFSMVAAGLAACLMLAAPALLAQEAAPKTCDWHYDLDLYLWGTGLSGSVGPKDSTTQVQANFSSLASHLDMAFMAHFEANDGTWGVFLDPYYVNLGDDATDGAGNPLHADLKQFMCNLGGTYRLYRSPKTSFDLTFGLRYVEMKTDIRPYGVPTQRRSIDWTDPIIGFKGRVALSKVWSFGYRGEGGGLGVGSRLTWSGVVRFDAAVSKHCSLGVGYIYYWVDYEKNVDPNDTGSFVYDMAQAGPALSVSFHW
jgi:hypothetical protein